MKKYTWLGPSRFVPPFGLMETGKQTPNLPIHTARYFASKGWIDMGNQQKTDESPKSKEVKLKENLKVGDK